MMNCPGNHMAHLAAALPNHIMMEVIDAGFETLLDVDNHIEDGYIVLGDAPGFGVEYDEEKLELSRMKRWKRIPSAHVGLLSPESCEDCGDHAVSYIGRHELRRSFAARFDKPR